MSIDDQIRQAVRDELKDIPELIRSAVLEAVTKVVVLRQPPATKPGSMLSVADIVTATGVNVKTVRRWLKEGHLKAGWAGTKRVIDPVDFKLFLEARHTKADASDVGDRSPKARALEILARAR